MNFFGMGLGMTWLVVGPLAVGRTCTS